MTDPEIDAALERAAQPPHPLPVRLLDRIASSIEPTLTPVRPLPPGWVLALGLVLLGATVAVFGASRVGFGGFAALALGPRVTIFAALALLGCLASDRVVREWIPGSGSRSSAASLALTSIALLAVFALLFQDYRTDHFWSAGIACLTTGLLWAVPTALLVTWSLRRGWAVNPPAAGLAAGTLAGLTGLTVLELQCSNFQALHVLLWHVLVVPLSAAAGVALGWLLLAHSRA